MRTSRLLPDRTVATPTTTNQQEIEDPLACQGVVPGFEQGTAQNRHPQASTGEIDDVAAQAERDEREPGTGAETALLKQVDRPERGDDGGGQADDAAVELFLFGGLQIEPAARRLTMFFRVGCEFSHPNARDAQ